MSAGRVLASWSAVSWIHLPKFRNRNIGPDRFTKKNPQLSLRLSEAELDQGQCHCQCAPKNMTSLKRNLSALFLTYDTNLEI